MSKGVLKKCLIETILVSLAVCFIFIAAGCGEANTGRDGRDGIDGRDGLSAYEIFCKNYIYIESEKQWIDDLVSGTLERVDNSVLEEKHYWVGDINSDFYEGELILTIDKYFYQKRFTVEDLHMIEAEIVELIDDGTDDGTRPGSQTYLITLKDKSKQAVVDAVYKLEIYAFAKEVYPNEFAYPIND